MFISLSNPEKIDKRRDRRGVEKGGGASHHNKRKARAFRRKGRTPAAWSVRGRMRKSSSNVMLQASTGNEDSGLSDSRVLGASPSVSPSLSGKTRSTAKPGSSARLRYTDCQPRVEMAAFSPPGTTIATGSRPPSTGAPGSDTPWYRVRLAMTAPHAQVSRAGRNRCRKPIAVLSLFSVFY